MELIDLSIAVVTTLALLWWWSATVAKPCPLCGAQLSSSLLEDGDRGVDDTIEYSCDCGYYDTELIKY